MKKIYALALVISLFPFSSLAWYNSSGSYSSTYGNGYYNSFSPTTNRIYSSAAITNEDNIKNVVKYCSGKGYNNTKCARYCNKLKTVNILCGGKITHKKKLKDPIKSTKNEKKCAKYCTRSSNNFNEKKCNTICGGQLSRFN